MSDLIPPAHAAGFFFPRRPSRDRRTAEEQFARFFKRHNANSNEPPLENASPLPRSPLTSIEDMEVAAQAREDMRPARAESLTTLAPYRDNIPATGAQYLFSFMDCRLNERV